MVTTKEEFIRAYLPEKTEIIDITQIDLDVSDFSINDVLRNLNRMYPMNSKTRMEIEGGERVVGVLCRSETLVPYNGLFILIGNDDIDTSIVSSRYIVICLSEKKIRNEQQLDDLNDQITDCLIHNYSSNMSIFPEFYKRFVYNESDFYDTVESGDY